MTSSAARGASERPGVLECPDVLVVGGGPAGSTVAGLLALAGWSVTLVDRARFPRPKPCGECLNPGAVALLARLGLLDAIHALRPARIEGWRLHADGATAEGRFGDDLFVLGVDRARLDAALLDRARGRGVRVLEGVHVLRVDAGGEADHPGAWARTDRREHLVFRPRVLIGADGLRSVVARRLGLVARTPRLRKTSITCHVAGAGIERPGDGGVGRLYLRTGLTVGVAPLAESGVIYNVTVAVPAANARSMAGDVLAFFHRALACTELRIAPGAIVEGPWVSGPFDWPVPRPWAGSVILVDDAAGYFDPLTGQGIHRALRSAELAAEAVDSALRQAADAARTDPRASVWESVPSHPLRSYARHVRREFAAGRRVQRVIEAVLSHDALRRRAVAILGRTRWLDRVVRMTGDVPATRGSGTWRIPSGMES